MRSFRIHIADKTYQVEIADLRQSPVRVTVNGKPYEVVVDWEESRSGTSWSQQLVPNLHPSGTAATAHQPVPVTETTDAEGEEVELVQAPMPGTILEIAVRVGDVVKRGQELCVLEAMKMRNSIRAPRSGRIAQIIAAPGSKVAYGDPLVRLARSI